MKNGVVYKCPYCDQDLKRLMSVQSLRELPAGRVANRALNVLVEWFEKGRSIPACRLIDLTWQNEINGGPDDASVAMSILIWRLRKRLERETGWTIISSGSGRRRGLYRLAPKL